MAAVASTLGLSSIPQLVSPSAVFDYLRILFAGGALSSLSSCLFFLRTRLLSALFLTASFPDDSAAHAWLLVWLSKQPAWRRARSIEVTTRDLTFGEHDNDDEDDATTDLTWRRLSFLPALDVPHVLWYKHRCLLVHRRSDPLPSYPGRFETLTLRLLTRDSTLLQSLLLDAKFAYDALRAQSTSVFVYDSSGRHSWRRLASASKRPLSSIILPPGVKESLLADAQEFLASKEWYHARGIPFRRGYLLHGVPGAGKTSLIQSLAGALGLDVYVVSIGRKGLDDADLAQLISELPERCVAVMEDIDAAFAHTVSRESSSSNEDSSSVGNGVTLSGLLNAIDGIGAHEGRILFATTNRYEALDPALCRPGRMDRHVEFGYASAHQARELFRVFYQPAGGDSEGSVPSEKDKDTELEDLAAQFAEKVPEGRFSMASLQGYLMMYKTCPREAVEQVGRWVEEEERETKKGRVET